MGDPRATVTNEVYQLLGKFLMWTATIMLAVVAKLAVESRMKKLTWKQIIFKVLISVCAGAIAAIGCERFNIQKWGAVVVPVVTLLGESLALYLINNSTKMYDSVAGKVFTGWKNKKDDQF